MLLSGCSALVPTTGKACNDDDDCGSSHSSETAVFDGVCLPGQRPVDPQPNRPAFARNALIVAEAGINATGTFTVIDPDSDDVDFVAFDEPIAFGRLTITVAGVDV